MDSLASIVNRDERLDELEITATQTEMVSEAVVPVLCTPLAVAAVTTAAAIHSIW